MKIVHIIVGLDQGGAESVLLRLVTIRSEFEHSVISMMDDGAYGGRLRAAGIDVHNLRMPRGRLTLQGLWRLFRLLRQLKPHVVQTWMYHADLVGGIIARLAGCKRVVWGIRHSDTADLTCATRAVLRLNAKLSRHVPSAIVSCSERAEKLHTNLGYDVSKFRIIPNGYDLTRFAPDEESRKRLRSEWRIEDNDVFGLVARWHPQKDHSSCRFDQ